MLHILKERTPTTGKDYTIDFSYIDDPDAGFSFPATPFGEPDFASMTPEDRANYEACLKDDRLTASEFNVSEWTYIEPAVGICSCGEEVILDCDYAGAVRCECGRWYNLFGQSLKDPEYWEEDEE